MSGQGVKVWDIAYVRFAAPDLDEMATFLEEFGFAVAERTEEALYARGSDPLPYAHVTHRGDATFRAVGFMVKDRADLDKLAGFDDAGPIEPVDGPAAGDRIVFTDPSGHRVEVVCWESVPQALPVADRVGINSARAITRRGELLRLDKGAAHVKRLGHAVLNVVDFRESERWYKERFGFITSDEIFVGSEEHTIGAFMRCDRGEAYTDHHTLFLVGTGAKGFNHAAFEVVDFDDLMLGHAHLKEKGRAHEWGVGRHLLGSQIFDYWRDPWGHTLEHWTDGDLLNAEFGSHKAPVEQLMGTQWGDPPPPTIGS